MQKSGIVIIDKPKGITTNALIQKIKKAWKVKKIGHAGTLDPQATGVVVVLVNNGTKLSNYFLSESKEYIFKMKLFVATDTFDCEGKIIETTIPRDFNISDIKNVIKTFNQLSYDQYPPIYSAIKVKGKKMYEYARANQKVLIEPRKVSIHKIKLLKYNQQEQTIEVAARCSKGTYIRSLAIDICKKLGTICYVDELRRVESGNFSIDQACSIDELDENKIISTFEALKISKWPIISLSNPADVFYGRPINLECSEKIIFIADSNNDILACYEQFEKGHYKCKRGGLNYESN